MSEELQNAIASLREHVLYLKEIGVTSLDVVLGDDEVVTSLKAAPISPPSSAGYVDGHAGASTHANASPPISNLRSEISNSASQEASKTAGSWLAQLPSLKERKPSKFFDKYNPGEEDRSQESGVGSRRATSERASVVVVSERAGIVETIAEIHAEIGANCTRCKLSQLGRTQVVNSVGNMNARLMFCGEAPGADEDRIGEPFVGRAGQLLTDIIEKGLEMARQEVFIGNINRCRPPSNRAPEEDECAVCKPFLLREIAVVQPKVIVSLGATATQNLLETKMPIGKLRGKFHDFVGSKVMPTFHPAYLLRDPNKKREVWEDMKLVKEYLRQN